MLNYVQILSTPTADTPGACLLLHFDNRRYLFGHLAEGTQRLMVQRKLSANKLEHIFLSGNIDWHSTGGLLGMILTIADVHAGAKAAMAEANQKRKEQGKAEKKKNANSGGSDGLFDALYIHGGKNLTHMLAAARRFVFRKGLPLRPHEIGTESTAASRKNSRKNGSAPDWQDDNIQVWNVPIVPAPAVAERSDGSPLAKRRRLSGEEEDTHMTSQGEAVAGSAADEEADQKVRESVVKEMFDSTWRLDALITTNLHDVQLPAKIFVRDEKTGHIQKYNGPMPDKDKDCPNIKVLVREPWPSTKISRLPKTTPSTTSMCYIAKSHPRRGKFMAAEAKRLGVAPVDFKKLTNGESVTLANGKVVTPGMVLEPNIPGHGFAIIDLRYQSLIDAFLGRPEWENADIMQGIEAMYWIFDHDVHKDKRIAAFMQRHSSIKHVVLSGQISPNHLALESPSSQIIKMHTIDGSRFPLPVFSNEAAALPETLSSGGVEAQVGRPGATIQFAPRVVVQDDKIVPPMDTLAPIQELASDPEILTLAKAAKEKVADPTWVKRIEELEKDMPNRDAEIVTLGTGSALPSKYRNVSATLIRVPGYGSYLLDCGENTLGQLRRVFGHSGADEILKDLKAIYISHLHADHHLGTASILRRRSELVEGSVAVIATSAFHGWLDEYREVEALGKIDSVYLGNGNGSTPGRQAYPSCPSNGWDLEKEVGLKSVEAVYVDHCHSATAVVLTWPTGLKIAYSGDCRPSPPFARLGKGAHLMIHECTFDDDLQGDALAKKHSTMSEALDIGRQMQARRILLTHFSQRYPKIPVISEESQNQNQAVDRSVLFAFDYMRVKLGEFKHAEAYLPALRRLYAEEEGRQS
ncbi:hypothetical protein QBC46DRAFT_379994 [Diplogelasinospora grovesii]|uniref:ribonuclease Z n=1 Tax=Diplogelasinospora grovesii TaxID=303347 RepID=A0AAN6NC79_9PEZI|nr:hypothetical protein QBC46DRAFT_379994 [Diplogelasinospora grovesii]